MKPYLTFSRADRHEISFRVGKNPENKNAADLARLIMDKNFFKSHARLKGLSVETAGVGDKVSRCCTIYIDWDDEETYISC